MDWGEQHPLMGGKSRRIRRSGTKRGGGYHMWGRAPTPHTWLQLPPTTGFPPAHSHKGVSPHTSLSSSKFRRRKSRQELHHHSGVPTGIQLRLVFARKFGTLMKALIQKGLVSCFMNVLGILGLPHNGRLCCIPIVIHFVQLADQLIKPWQADFPRTIHPSCDYLRLDI